MSHSFIAYIMVGPHEFSEEQIERAKMVGSRVKTLCAELVSFWGNTENPLMDVDVVKLREELKKLSPDLCVDEEADTYAETDIEGALSDFMLAWEGEYEDCGNREYAHDGISERIVVAGETTGGGTPDGEGWVTCDRANKLGMFEQLGIK